MIETGSGQEPKQEFKYLMVQQAEGSYIWNDYNQDSIQQVNEFEIAPFGDLGNFERFVVINNEFIRTSKTEFKQLIDFRPSKFIDEKKYFCLNGKVGFGDIIPFAFNRDDYILFF